MRNLRRRGRSLSFSRSREKVARASAKVEAPPASLVEIIDRTFPLGCPIDLPFEYFGRERPLDIWTSVVTFDEDKSRANIAARGLSFTLAGTFVWETAVIEYDRRKDYGEARFRAYGFLGDRLHALVFTHRDDDLRVISLRRANRREQVAYAKETGSLPHR